MIPSLDMAAWVSQRERVRASNAHLGMNVVKSVVGWPILKRAAMGSHSVSGGRVVAISITVHPTDLIERVCAKADHAHSGIPYI